MSWAMRGGRAIALYLHNGIRVLGTVGVNVNDEVDRAVIIFQSYVVCWSIRNKHWGVEPISPSIDIIHSSPNAMPNTIS
jgi:hypothetical protein